MTNKIDSNVQWQVESLRFTLFYDAVTQQHPVANLWQTITGLPPYNRTERPQEGLLIEEGQWNDNALTTTIRPDRIDITIGAVASSLPILPNIGNIDIIASILNELMDKIPFENAIRLAFGAVLLHPEQDHYNAYQSLAEFLPHIKIDPESREFLYRINFPAQSKYDPSIEINRLRTWSVVVLRFINIVSDKQNVKELFTTRLELDINTHQDRILSSSSVNMHQLMRELVDEAVAIAGEGKSHA